MKGSGGGITHYLHPEEVVLKRSIKRLNELFYRRVGRVGLEEIVDCRASNEVSEMKRSILLDEDM